MQSSSASYELLITRNCLLTFYDQMGFKSLKIRLEGRLKGIKLKNSLPGSDPKQQCPNQKTMLMCLFKWIFDSQILSL